MRKALLALSILGMWLTSLQLSAKAQIQNPISVTRGTNGNAAYSARCTSRDGTAGVWIPLTGSTITPSAAVYYRPPGELPMVLLCKSENGSTGIISGIPSGALIPAGTHLTVIRYATLKFTYQQNGRSMDRTEPIYIPDGAWLGIVNSRIVVMPTSSTLLVFPSAAITLNGSELVAREAEAFPPTENSPAALTASDTCAVTVFDKFGNKVSARIEHRACLDVRDEFLYPSRE